MPLSLVTAPTSEPITVAEAKRQLLLNSTAGEPAPAAPTVALPSTPVAGNCDNGAWRIGFTFVTADGETDLGDLSDIVTIADKTVNGKIAVSAIALGGSAVTARNAYAVSPGATAAKFIATIADNTTTTLTVNVAAASLGVQAPTTNTTADPELVAWITAVRERGELATNRAFLPQTWDYILDGFPGDGFIEIPKPPLVSVTYVHYVDTGGVTRTLTANTDYLVQAPAGPRCARGRIALPFAGVWPVTLRQMGAVTVRFVAGYASAAAVPGMLKAAMKLDLGMLYQNREGVVLGLRGSPEELPMGLRAMYWSYRSHATQRLRVADRMCA